MILLFIFVRLSIQRKVRFPFSLVVQPKVPQGMFNSPRF